MELILYQKFSSSNESKLLYASIDLIDGYAGDIVRKGIGLDKSNTN